MKKKLAFLGIVALVALLAFPATAAAQHDAFSATARIVQTDPGTVTDIEPGGVCGTGKGKLITDEVFQGSFTQVTGKEQALRGARVTTTQSVTICFFLTRPDPKGEPTVVAFGGTVGGIFIVTKGPSKRGTLTGNYFAALEGTLNLNTGALSVEWRNGLWGAETATGLFSSLDAHVGDAYAVVSRPVALAPETGTLRLDASGN